MTTDLKQNWVKLGALTTYLLGERGHLIDAYHRLFERYRQDEQRGADLVLGLYRAPASTAYHHDWEGGLVAHMLEMWAIYEWMVPMLKSMGLQPFDKADIWQGIIHHDLNKIYRYTFVSQDPWLVSFANDPMTDLLGAAQKSLQILIEMNLQPSIMLHNALLNAEGGYSKAPTHTQTTLARMLYLLDDMSANVVDRLRSGRFWDGKREEKKT